MGRAEILEVYISVKGGGGGAVRTRCRTCSKCGQVSLSWSVL